MRIHFFSKLAVLVALSLSLSRCVAPAQTGFALYNFGKSGFKGGILGVFTNSDGINPNGWFASAGGVLYGTSQNGGTNGSGTIFSIRTNGAFNLLYTFPFNNVGVGNTNGANPNGGLALSTNLLYGTTAFGGTNDQGVVFSINTNGTGFQTLHTFTSFINTNKLGVYTNKDGANPSAGLIVSGRKTFGTAEYGGYGGNGVVFSCSNTTYAVLRHFSAGNYRTNIPSPGVTNIVFTNSDGANPRSRLVLLGTNLFGTTAAGGTNGYGTIFRVSTNSSPTFTVLYHFDTNGASPNTGLVFSGGILFGISDDIIYSIGTNGANFTVLYQFDGPVDTTATAASTIMITNDAIYGVASSLGDYGNGRVFSMNTNGTGFTVFHDFSLLPFGYPTPPQTNSDGAIPNGGMTIANGVLYGAASQGGTNATGVLIQPGPPPPFVASQTVGANLQLGFQTFDGLGYTLQQSSNLAAGSWTNLASISGDGTVQQFTFPKTNGTPTFFRVRQP